MITRLLAFLLLLALPAGAAEKLRVVATFAPIYAFTQSVAGDAAEVEQLLPPGGEPHGFALSPKDIRKLARADVIVENGLGFEDWLDDALRTSNAVRVASAAGVKMDDENPHVWLDPVIAIRQIEVIRNALAKRDPANADTYRANAAAAIARLKALDKEIRETVRILRDRRLLTAHDAFHYFAKRYGFKVVGVFEPIPGRAPSPKALRELRETIRTSGVKVLFSQPGSSPHALRALSKELGLPVVEIDPLEIGAPSADFYETGMRRNLTRLKEALHGGG